MAWVAEIHPLDNNVIRIREEGGETIICEIPIACESERALKWKWARKMAASYKMLKEGKALVEAIENVELEPFSALRIAAVFERFKQAIAAAESVELQGVEGK